MRGTVLRHLFSIDTMCLSSVRCTVFGANPQNCSAEQTGKPARCRLVSRTIGCEPAIKIHLRQRRQTKCSLDLLFDRVHKTNGPGMGRSNKLLQTIQYGGIDDCCSSLFGGPKEEQKTRGRDLPMPMRTMPLKCNPGGH